MKFYACSQIGIGKSKNEDRMIIGQSVIAGGSFETDIETGIVAIADGVGGNNAGAVASHFVASRLSYENDVTKEILIIAIGTQDQRYINEDSDRYGIDFYSKKYPVEESVKMALETIEVFKTIIIGK